MKPTAQILEAKAGRRSSLRCTLPRTDHNFRPNSHADFSGRCSGSPAPSFWRISDDYFAKEASGQFLCEAAVFALMIVTAAVPMVQGARSAVHLLRVVGLL